MTPASGRADLHLHTLASDGLVSPRQLVDYAEHRTSLDVIAVTDHDETSGAREARDYALESQYRVQVIPGVEVTTREGHLLALWIEERPPALRPALETIEWVVSRGGVCIAPHPFTRLTHSLTARPLVEAVRRGLLAGVECLNASPAGRRSRERAEQFARETHVARVGGSDAHMLGIVGLSYTLFPGRTPGELRQALADRTTEPAGRFATPGEIAGEAIPQLARSMIHLPLRRVHRALRARTSQAGPGPA